MFLGTVRFANRTGFARFAHPTTNISLPEHALSSTETPLIARYSFQGTDYEHFVQWKPFGPRYMDGNGNEAGMSFRIITITFPLHVDANEDVVVSIYRQEADSPGTFSHTMPGGLGCQLTINGNAISVLDEAHSVLEAGPHAKCYLFRRRIPSTPCWVDTMIEFRRNSKVAHWWKWYGSSDPSYSTTIFDLTGPVTMRWFGAESRVRHASLKVLSTQVDTETDRTYTLLNPAEPQQTKFGDGHSQALTGVLLLGTPETALETSTFEAERIDSLEGVSEDWAQHGNYGPLLYVPPAPPWMATDVDIRAAARAKADADYAVAGFSTGPWRKPQYGLEYNPNQAGDQADFGAIAYWWIARSGEPSGLKAAQRSAYQEACRPMWFREADGSPITAAAHPNCAMFPCRPHESGSDFLGKPNHAFPPEARVFGPEVADSPWFGFGLEHWSFNHLAHYALLTGDRLAVAMCNAHAEVWLLGNTIQGSGVSAFLSDISTPRQIGRCNHSGANLFWVTGRADLKERLRQRVTVTVVQGPDVNSKWTGDDPVTVKIIRKTGGATSQITTDAYRPWEEGQGAQGILATYNCTKDEEVLRILLTVLTTHVLYGWQDRRTVNQACSTSGNWSGTPVVNQAVNAISGGTFSGTLTAYHTNESYFHGCTGALANGMVLQAASGATVTVNQRRGGFIVATAMGWNAGEPLTEEQLRILYDGSPPGQEARNVFENVLWSDNSDFNNWSIGAVIAASEMLAGISPTAHALAEEIKAAFEAARSDPGGHGWDDVLMRWTPTSRTGLLPFSPISTGPSSRIIFREGEIAAILSE